MDLRHEQDVGHAFVLPGFFPSARQYSTVGLVPNGILTLPPPDPPPDPPCPEVRPHVSLVVFAEGECLWNGVGALHSDNSVEYILPGRFMISWLFQCSRKSTSMSNIHI